jgi:hypothetical protein
MKGSKTPLLAHFWHYLHHCGTLLALLAQYWHTFGTNLAHFGTFGTIFAHMTHNGDTLIKEGTNLFE